MQKKLHEMQKKKFFQMDTQLEKWLKLDEKEIICWLILIGGHHLMCLIRLQMQEKNTALI